MSMANPVAQPAGAGNRPPQHDEQKAAPRAEGIYQFAAQCVHDRVSNQKGSLQVGKARIRNRDLALDSGDRERQRLTIEIADCDRAVN